MSDLAQYGVEDYWASPLESLSSGAGDCEDYAIAKYVALEESGIASADLQLEIVRDVEHQATHAVVEVRYKDEWLTFGQSHVADHEHRTVSLLSLVGVGS